MLWHPLRLISELTKMLDPTVGHLCPLMEMDSIAVRILQMMDRKVNKCCSAAISQTEYNAH